MTLRERIRTGLSYVDGSEPAPALSDDRRVVDLAALAERFWIDTPPQALAGRCVLIQTRRPLSAALALASLDGLAARMILCPPDLAAAHVSGVMAQAGVDVVLCDAGVKPPPGSIVHVRLSEDLNGSSPAPQGLDASSEWVLFTSGTAGSPKMVVHSLEGLTGAIAPRAPSPDEPPVVWSTFYDIRRYGGLQILLRALLGGRAMCVSSPDEPPANFLERLRVARATHISGTPSHWRRVLMTPGLGGIAPRYVRLSGEIADQSLLDRLKTAFPQASVGHAFASTEAGVGLEVTDGLEGFPASLVERGDGPVRMRIIDGALQIRSLRTAIRYVGGVGPALADVDGFVDTGDMVERCGERYHFVGRRSGVVNVGGLKVHPEEVEAVINARPEVRSSRVKGRRNPITGALLVADVVLADPAVGDDAAARVAILAHCRAVLPPYKAPTSIRFVAELAMTAGGKLDRSVA